MAYTAWSVVFGEQPTAAKWNQLGANDAGFKDGTNIDDGAIILRHMADASVDMNAFRNGVAFAARRTSNLNISGSFTDIVFNTEDYDIGSNYNNATGIFTAPYNGIYSFKGSMYVAATGTITRALMGATMTGTYSAGMDSWQPDYEMTKFRIAEGEWYGYMAAGATIKIQGFASGATTNVNNNQTRFFGHLVTRV